MASFVNSYTAVPTITPAEYSLIAASTSSVPRSVSAAAATYRVVLDLGALQFGDTFELKFYTTVASAAGGASQKVLETFTLIDTYSSLWVSPDIDLLDGFDITLKRTTGTDRAIRYEVHVDARTDVIEAIAAASAVASNLLDTGLEGGGITVADAIRAILRQLLAKRSGYDTGTIVVRKFDDSADSHTIVMDDPTTPTEWTSVTIHDLDP